MKSLKQSFYKVDEEIGSNLCGKNMEIWKWKLKKNYWENFFEDVRICSTKIDFSQKKTYFLDFLKT